MIGLATFGVFLVVESMPHVHPAVLSILRVLIAPLWLTRTLQMMVGMGTWPVIAQLIVALPLLFAPYLFADWALARARVRRASRFHAAAV